MAYMNQEKKAEIAALLKKTFGTSAKKRGFRYSLKVRHHSSIIMTISRGTVDFLGSYTKEMTHDHLSPSSHENFTGEAREIIKKALECLNLNNYDNSDIMTDYFEVGHYVHLRIGSYDKPYQLEA